jgi:hypothetical protein
MNEQRCHHSLSKAQIVQKLWDALMTESANPARHGSVLVLSPDVSRLLPEQESQPSPDALKILAEAMKAKHDTVDDGPDSEENLYVPAGYTYLGQFIDHDLTFDTTSSLETKTEQNRIGNDRTPRFDLDCVYGSGPDDQPYFYAADGASLILGATLDGLHQDLARAPGNGRALIGDPRNDENSIVNQIQSSFIRFHNAVVQRFAQSGLQGRPLFQRARDEVRWTYQKILVEDFLPRIISKGVREAFQKDVANGQPYKLFEKRGPLSIPVEFSGAAYRFGHSMVRNGYRLNDAKDEGQGVFHIFRSKDPRDGDTPDDSLVGFEPLPVTHVINKWSRFYPHPLVAETEPGSRPSNNADEGTERLQFAYKIDTSVVDPLAQLPESVAGGNGPSLILRNLERGAIFKLACGEAVAKKLAIEDPLPPEHIVVRREKDPVDDKKHFDLFPISKLHNDFAGNTPLWFYVLAEAQQAFIQKVLHDGKQDDFDEDYLLKTPEGQGAQLGPVGGRIVLEVFHALLENDPESYRCKQAQNWNPLIKGFRMWHIMNLNLNSLGLIA